MSSFVKSGIELDSKLSTGFDVNGHIAVKGGSDVSIRVEMPQDDLELFSYKYNIFRPGKRFQY